MLKSIKNIIIYWFLMVFIFLYVFQPFLPIIKLPHTLDLLIIVYLFYCILYKKKIEITWIKYFRGFIPFFIYFLVLFLHCVTSGYYIEGYLNTFISFFTTIAHLFLSITFLMTFKKNNYSKESMINIFLHITFVQFIFCLLAFCFKPIKLLFDSLIIMYSNNTSLINGISRELGRGFGFTDNLYDIFGVRLAFLLVLLFIQSLEKNNKFYQISTFVLLFMPLINARTGVLLTLLGVGISFIFYSSKFQIKKLIKSALTIIILLCILPLIIYFLPNNTQIWLKRGFDSTINLVLEGKKEGVYGQILEDDLSYIPDNYIFGEGIRPSNLSIGGVDNGYIQELWLFGFVGIILYFYGTILFFYLLYRSTNYNNVKCISICFPIIYIVYTIKLLPLFLSHVNLLLFGLPLMMSIKDNIKANNFNG